jgi:adenine-specific DNA-methyltransferase
MFFPIYVNERTKSLSLENLDQGIAVYPRKSDGSDGRWMWGKARCQKDLKLLVPKLIQHRNEYDIFVRDYMNRGDKERTRKQKSIWDSKSYNNQAGTQEVKALIGGDVMSFPKPKELIQDIVQMGASDGDIVLDFFSGSATAAHAVMDLNSRHNGKRIFIQVQLPESTDEKGGAFKAGFKNICEIGKERIRRAAKKIKEETNADIDYGFRVYRLDSSNMEDVYYKPQDYDQSNLDLFGDNVKSDRTADDLLAQVMLAWCLPLSLKIEQTEISGKKVFKVAENSLYACFDGGIDETFAKAIAKDEPMRIVFKDNGFASDTSKVNVQQLLKQLSPATEMKVI